MTTSTKFTKDPSGVLDWKFDWAGLTNGSEGAVDDWLSDGETISSHTVTADDGITIDSSTLTDTNTSVTAWLSGGTANLDYTVTCQIVTSAGRTDERSITIRVQDR